MKYLMTFLKVLTALVWVILLINIVMPFPGKAGTSLYLLFGLVIIAHGLQTLMVFGVFRSMIPVSKKDYWSVMIFGVAAMHDIRQRAFAAAQEKAE